MLSEQRKGGSFRGRKEVHGGDDYNRKLNRSLRIRRELEDIDERMLVSYRL